MKKIKRYLSEIFTPDRFNDIDVDGIYAAFNDSMVRAVWLSGCFSEIQRINMEVDKRLLSGHEKGLVDLCARRKAYQDMLEAVLSARRTVTQDTRPNPRPEVSINLDRVTA